MPPEILPTPDILAPPPRPTPIGIIGPPEPDQILQPLSFTEAISYFRGKINVPQWHWTEVWQEEHAAAFVVARAMKTEVIEILRAAVDSAIAEGISFHDFRRELKPALQRAGWWGKQELPSPRTGEVAPVQLGSTRRLRTIYDTNLRMAHAAGRWQQLQAAADVRPLLRYSAILDGRTRRLHRRLHGTVLPIGDPFWSHYYPPNGWHCRCTVVSLSRTDAAHYGWQPDETPPYLGPDRRWTNPRTGGHETVPAGIDPGFAFNPGQASRLGWARDWLAHKAAAADPALARAVTAAAVRADDFAAFLANPAGHVPVMVLPAAVAAAIGAKNGTVVLSAESAEKNRRNHPELTLEEYRLLPGLPENAQLIIKDGDKTVVIVGGGNRWYWAAVKTTGTGLRNFLTSFRRVSPERVARWLERDGIDILVDTRS